MSNKSSYMQGFEFGCNEARRAFDCPGEIFCRRPKVSIPVGFIERHAFLAGFSAGITKVLNDKLPEVHAEKRDAEVLGTSLRND